MTWGQVVGSLRVDGLVFPIKSVEVASDGLRFTSVEVWTWSERYGPVEVLTPDGDVWLESTTILHFPAQSGCVVGYRLQIEALNTADGTVKVR